MRTLLTGTTVFTGSCFHDLDVAIEDGRIVSISKLSSHEGFSVIELNDCVVVPGFVDVHVHLREPGFSYKETISSGTSAAAAGGYTDVMTMPNLTPVPDCLPNLRQQLDLISENALIHVHPYGSITMGQLGQELGDLAAMAPFVAGYSDDGRGVQTQDMMRAAMLRAKPLGRPIVAHCEDNSLLNGGCIHDGQWAKSHGLPGICAESEWRQIQRDLTLVEETGCPYHVCHISTMQSVDLIRKAKAKGLPVSCETAPHYLLLCDEDLQDEGRFKMNPPLRSRGDMLALRGGILDGTIDVIATDHAPHSAQEKSQGLLGSAMGIVGLETAFPMLYTKLVKTGIMSLELLIEKMSVAPRRLFQLSGGEISVGMPGDLTVLNLNCPHIVQPSRFHSLGRATPFEGEHAVAAVEMTFCGGKLVYQREDAKW